MSVGRQVNIKNTQPTWTFIMGFQPYIKPWLCDYFTQRYFTHTHTQNDNSKFFFLFFFYFTFLSCDTWWVPVWNPPGITYYKGKGEKWYPTIWKTKCTQEQVFIFILIFLAQSAPRHLMHCKFSSNYSKNFFGGFYSWELYQQFLPFTIGYEV